MTIVTTTVPDDDDGLEPTPPPGEPIPDAGLAGPPSGALTGAFRAPARDEDDVAPAGPPSVAVTGAFAAPARDAFDVATPRSSAPSPSRSAVTEVASDSAAIAPTLIEPTPPRRGTGRVDRGDLANELADDGGRPTGPPPVHDVRPVEPTSPGPRPASGGGGLAVVVCLACLGGIAFLVHRAFPELFARRGGSNVQVTRPGASEWVQGSVVVAIRATGFAGPAHWTLRGGPVDASGATEVPADGNLTLAVGAVPDGVHDLELRLEGKTAAGDLALSTSRVRVQVDGTAPVLELEAPVPGPGGATPVVVRVRDASPVQLACQVDGRLAWTRGVDPDKGGAAVAVTRPVQLSAGRHLVRLEAMDGAGHLTSAERTVDVGAEPPKQEPPEQEPPEQEPPKQEPPKVPAPTLVVTWPAAAVIAPGAVVDAQVVGATAVSVRVDGREVQASLPWRLEAGAVPDGDHMLSIVVTSPGGAADAMHRVIVDGTPPTLEVEVAGEVEHARITGRVDDALDPAPRLTLRVDGGPPVSVASLPHRLELRAGEHEVEVAARDAAGNLTRRTARVAVSATAPDRPPGTKLPKDTVAPTIEVVSPTAPFIVREARIEVRLADAGAIRAHLRLDGVEMGPRRVDGPGSATLTLDGVRLAEGSHELVVEAEDPSGNRRASTTTFTLDSVAPELALVVGARSWPGRVELQARASDATSGIAAVEARLPNGQVVPFAPEGELLVARLDLPPGAWSVTIVARDRAGNETSVDRMLTVEEAVAPSPIAVQIPARSASALRIEGSAPPGSTVIVDANGERLASTRSLPVTVSVGPGRYFIVVTVTPPGGQPRRSQGQVEVDASGPTIRGLRLTPLSRDRAQVQAEVIDQGPATVVVLANGAQVATALPCEVPLALGKNEVVIIARDDVGNETREARTIDVAPAAPPPPVTPPPPARPQGDPRELRAEELLAAGNPAEAIRVIDAMLAEVRTARSAYVVRARAHQALAAATQDPTVRRNELNAAVGDMTTAIVKYSGDVRSAHFRFRGELFQALNRRRAAEDDFEAAEQLEARGR